MVRVATIGLVYDVLLTLLVYLALGLYHQRKQLRIIAERDQLTGLYSRRGFMDRFNQINRSNPQNPMTVTFIDLDDFKLINDLYGHLVGDEALKNLAQDLTEHFPKDALIGRTGGDEFCVAIMGKEPKEAGELIMKAFHRDRSFRIVNQEYRYTISAGYADYPVQADDRKHLMTLADQALYAAKLGGKHQCLHYEPSMSNIKRSQLGFNVKNIASGIPGAFLVYKADASEEIVYANDDLIYMMGCSDFDEFLSYTESNFTNIIHPDDREKAEREIWEQIRMQQKATRNNQKHYDDFVSYRVQTKDGEEKEIMDLGRLIHMDNYGDVFCVFIRETDTIRNMKLI